MRRADVATILSEALLDFDRIRYQMGDFIIMPNHVHLLAAFPDPEKMRKQFASWLSFSARQIHALTGERGHFWQQEPFDHLVRSSTQYEYLRRYIVNNPAKAGLKEGQYLYYRRAD